MDEPTNHLDINSREVLEIIDKLATRIIELGEKGKLQTNPKKENTDNLNSCMNFGTTLCLKTAGSLCICIFQSGKNIQQAV